MSVREHSSEPADDRQEVVFWHFWGGADRAVVEDVVRRFNESQNRFRVRAIAMPGNNLQAKLFLSVAGGDPPDIVNQDDPIVAEWASRGIIDSFEAHLSDDDRAAFDDFLFPAARKLGTWNGQLYALCNGLDIRALYYNRTLLESYGLDPPQTLEDLDRIALAIAPPQSVTPQTRTFGWLPDSRRLWSWGYAFGGTFVDEGTGAPRIDHPRVVEAAGWMQRYAKWYGSDTINRFRAGDQSLPNKGFPLLPAVDHEMAGQYAVLMDGQWRTRDVQLFVEDRNLRGIAAPEFGVCALPAPIGGLADAGWVNGNVFVIPSNADCPDGAVAFARFWIGLDDPGAAAETCAAGGWIPVSQEVVDHSRFQQFLAEQSLFAEFVRLAASPSQFPVPVIPGAPKLKRTVEQAAARIMDNPELDPAAVLGEANARLKREIGGIQ
jgi:multiple sugar transport system substrate-binding protein